MFTLYEDVSIFEVLLLNHEALNLQLLTILRVGSRVLLLFHVSQLNF